MTFEDGTRDQIFSMVSREKGKDLVVRTTAEKWLKANSRGKMDKRCTPTTDSKLHDKC